MEKAVDNFDPTEILRDIIKARPLEAVRPDGARLELRPLEEIPAATAAAISSIEAGPHGFRLRFFDKLKAAQLLLAAGAGEPPEENNLLEMLLAGSEEGVDYEDGVFAE